MTDPVEKFVVRERDMSTEKNAISFEAQGCSNEKTVADNIMFTVLLPASPRPVPDEVEPHSPKDLFQEEELEKAEDLRKRKRIKRERNLSLRGRKCQIVIGGEQFTPKTSLFITYASLLCKVSQRAEGYGYY